MSALVWEDAAALAAWIRSRRISAMEVLEAHLRQLHRHNGALNAVVTLDEEGARRAAAAADAALARGNVRGPLHGLPMTLKDGHSTQGIRTAVGFPALADHRPAADGTVAARLKAAGAVIMGKTNVSLLMGDIQSANPVFGRTNNPWNLERTPGGSSGGAAAAVAAGLTPLEVGSDLGGSIRLPAHFCGVYGFKPTERRISVHGLLCAPPGAPRNMRQMLSIGPLARSVADLDLAFRVLAGPDPADPEVMPLPLRPATEPDLHGLRVAWSPGFPGIPTASAVRAAVARVAGRLTDAGALVEEALPRLDWASQADTFQRLMTQMVTASLPPGAHGPDTAPPTSLAEHLAALQQRDGFIAAWETFFDQWDLLLCPAGMDAAFAHCAPMTPLLVEGREAGYLQSLAHCTPFSLTGHPAVVLPAGRDRAGLPVGIQLVARRWADERLLSLARGIAELTQGFQKPPGY